jgi:beta-phosphoglucomutase-like phosphatase (HAD superfamily)
MWVRQGRGSVSVSENQPLHSARTAYDAVIFDMDGVVTDTASVHARAWKALFDEVLPRLSTTPVQPFDADTDYRRYVDGRPREDGIRTFLASRGIELPDGLPGDPPDDSGTQPTIAALAARKQALFDEHLAADGVPAFPDAVALLHRLHEQGIPTAVVTSS